jgi:glucose-1-phosphate cytidylyltransferase
MAAPVTQKRHDEADNHTKVVILSGGLGTRLREETEFRPKPMVNVGNKPLLWHIMKTYSHYGYSDFIVCLGYKGNMIKEYFLNYGAMNSDFTIELDNPNRTYFHSDYDEKNWKVTLADTGELTQTGARIKQIEKYIDGNWFMVTYGDGISNVNIEKLVEYHQSHKKIGTVTGVRPSSRFGELITDKHKVVEFNEKPQATAGLINGGYFVFEKAFFSYLKEDDSCTLEKEPLMNLANDGQLMVYEHDGFWQCIDTYRELEYVNDIWRTSAPLWKVW